MLKDNKIDIMSKKIGEMLMLCNHGDTPMSDKDVALVSKGLRQLLYDLELLRKCTLDNPDFKWDDNTSHGYTQAKSDAFKGISVLDEDGFQI